MSVRKKYNVQFHFSPLIQTLETQKLDQMSREIVEAGGLSGSQCYLFSHKHCSLMESWTLQERAFTGEQDKMICILPEVFMVTNHSISCHSVIPAQIFYNFFSFSEKHSLSMSSACIHLKEIRYHVFQGRRAKGRKAMAILSLWKNVFGSILDYSVYFFHMSIIAEQREGLHHLIVLCIER